MKNINNGNLRRIEFKRLWTPLWTRPEWSSSRGFLIWWEVVKKLKNGCAVVLLKSLASPFDAVIEVIWFLVDEEFDDSLGSGKWLVAWQLLSLGGKVGGIRQVLFGRASLSGKQSFEVISRPLIFNKKGLSER